MNVFNKTMLAFALLAGCVMPAAALDANRAGTVVTIMEKISEESGEDIYYGAGDVFLELDDNGYIAAAGFSDADWVVTFDEVVTGYMATIPQDEFDGIFRDLVAMLEASTALSDAQKAEVRQDMVLNIAEAQRARESGMPHAHAVLPFADRLYPMFFGE